MISWHIEMRGGHYVLVERDYPAQGISPFYAVLCRLEPGEAGALHKSGLVRVQGCEVPAPPHVDVKGLLFIRQPQEGVLELWLRLPEREARNCIELQHPGYEAMLDEAARDSQKRANLVANTGVSDFWAEYPVGDAKPALAAPGAG